VRSGKLHVLRTDSAVRERHSHGWRRRKVAIRSSLDRMAVRRSDPLLAHESLLGGHQPWYPRAERAV
jgi:hypothetical protein